MLLARKGAKLNIKVYKRGNKLWLYARIDKVTYRYPSGYDDTYIKYVEKNKELIFNKLHKPSLYSLKFEEYGNYVLNITSSGRNSFSQHETMQKFKKLCEFFHNIEITDIRTSLIMEWQNSLNFAPKTILNYRSVLNLILETALNDTIIDRNPLNGVKAPKNKKELTEYYNLDDINTLVSNAKGQFKNILEFAFFSGMRPSEIIALKWDNIDFNDLTIFVQTRIREQIEDLPKGYKQRIIDLLPRAEKALQRQKSISGDLEYVFVTQYRKRYNTPDTLDNQFKKLCELSKVRIGRFYDTKHSFTTLMLQNNESETWLTQQLGHQNISITRKHYVGRLRLNKDDCIKKYG